ncbi:MAG: 2-C-methyl-D-erythritol 4-phosphate cytidylyltransferase [Caldicoprobacter sp.]|uniref:2-C-methyl-D-erythritol 4-phosphate cytidylyltransferase n=1 Tax=Caldicoprobacter sp. TaxID=2004500 RepID=UPI001D69B847|nr:2-C-methyl-D-erythritol 4-phosphate cytidylyltransferase [Clostridia bacterium]
MKGRNYAIVVAAGQGKRMGTDVSKQYLLLDDKPVVVHALRAFDEQPAIEAIVLVVAPSDVKRVKDSIVSEYEFKKPVLVVEGGQERQQSVYNGLKALGELGDVDIVVIHDGVRPFVTEQMIQDSILAADRYGAAVVGVPVKDTIKKVDDEQFVICTPQRSQLWLVQTPQAFKYRLIWEAHEKAVQDGFCGTDDAVLVERLGHPVKMVMGSYCNIKITTREDLILAREFMAGGLVYEDRHGL